MYIDWCLYWLVLVSVGISSHWLVLASICWYLVIVVGGLYLVHLGDGAPAVQFGRRPGAGG